MERAEIKITPDQIIRLSVSVCHITGRVMAGTKGDKRREGGKEKAEKKTKKSQCCEIAIHKMCVWSWAGADLVI
jgi:hypothetical protein